MPPALVPRALDGCENPEHITLARARVSYENLCRDTPTTIRGVPTTIPAKMGRMDIQSTPDTAAALAQRVVSVALGNEDMLVIVDPMSTGATLAFEAAKLGLKICCVWSDVCPESLRHFVADGMAIDFVGEVHHRGDLKATCHALTQIGTVCNVIVGSEPGVECRETGERTA